MRNEFNLRIFAGLVAGMLLVSLIPLAMPSRAYAQSQVNINGAGATFPFLLIDTWRVEYQKVKSNVNINYQSIGSGGGIRQFTEKTVDFGATDAPLNAERTAALPGPAVHIPETIGSVVAAYYIPGFEEKGLKLTGPLLADIFLGKIKKWDDPAIKALNPDAPLPSQDVIVVHRSDGSGTTFVWTSYLSLISQEWNDKVGKGTSVQWPAGVGAPGNEGVANTVRTTLYTIGYVELAYALTTGMNYAYIQNKAGNFIEPTLDSTSAAVGSAAASLPKGSESWEPVSLLDASGSQSYPIASFSYLLLYSEMSTSPTIDSAEKAKALLEFVSWAIGPTGQEYAKKLSYVPLPEAVVKLNQETLASMTYNGQPVLATPSAPQPFTISSTLDGKSYSITGKSEQVKATSFKINPKQSVQVQVEGQGEIELTLPKSMIDGISSVKAGSQTIQYTTKDNTDSTTLTFTVPEGADSLEILGAMVVPEFPVIAAIVLAASLVAVVAFTRFARNVRSGLTGLGQP